VRHLGEWEVIALVLVSGLVGYVLGLVVATT
jgi:hypothetical protein